MLEFPAAMCIRPLLLRSACLMHDSLRLAMPCLYSTVLRKVDNDMRYRASQHRPEACLCTSQLQRCGCCHTSKLLQQLL
jgi:hypothetical protein